jgi:hypothetical protein
MSTPTELTTYIRYALTQLKARNDHHAFEALCRQFTRLRICPNVIPATGPVGAGGDFGRDFESFRTYLSSSPIAEDTFLAKATDAAIVGACTLQDNPGTKLSSDIRTILSAGQHVDAVLFFCANDWPIGKRTKTVIRLRKKHNIDITVFDGAALAEQLCDPTVFWIAQEYLKVPAELYPKPVSESEEYDIAFRRWEDGKRQPNSFADFCELKFAIRESTFKEQLRPHLAMWIERMERLASSEGPSSLRRRAVYEIAVATLRGQNNLDPQFPRIKQYFAEVEGLREPAEVEDAQVLLMYCAAARMHSHISWPESQILHWHATTSNAIEQALAATPGPNTTCNLLMTKGALELVLRESAVKMKEFVEAALRIWGSLLDQVHRAPLFDLGRFVNLLTVLAPHLATNNQFLVLCDRADTLLETRSSGRIVAQKRFERAGALIEAEQLTGAIRHLQASKIAWFQGETINRAVLSILLISRAYLELGMTIAAKYYAMAAILITTRATEEAIKLASPKAVHHLHNILYASGEWKTALHLTELSVMAQGVFKQDPYDLDLHSEFADLMFYTALILAFTKRFLPDSYAAASQIAWHGLEFEDLKEQVEGFASDRTTWVYKEHPEEIWRRMQKDLVAEPYSDCGEERTYRWRAFGVHWSAVARNHPSVIRATEELISTIQIVLVDMADEDLVMLPTTAEIRCDIHESDKIDLRAVPGNAQSRWDISLPRIVADDDLGQYQRQLMAVAVELVARCSCIATGDLDRRLLKKLNDGLIAKTFQVRPYRELHHETLPDSYFADDKNLPKRALSLGQSFDIKEHYNLSALTTNGPEYTEERGIEAAANRYRRMMPVIRYTLPRLLADPDIRRRLQVMRESGMKDWQIIGTIFNAVANYRVQQQFGKFAGPSELLKEAMTEITRRPEEASDSEVPLDEFTEEKLDFYYSMYIGSVAKTWGIQLHNQTPDIEALKRLLEARFGLGRDDAVHEALVL